MRAQRPAIAAGPDTFDVAEPVSHTIVVRGEEGLALHVVAWAPVPGSTPSEPSFLLVHGLASNARTWDGVATELARRGHAAYAVDLRGHGRSDKPDGGYDVATVAEDVCRLLDILARSFGIRQPVLAGQSWGGNVVLEAAARCPGGVLAVVGVDGGSIHLAEEFPEWSRCAAALAPPPIAGMPAVDFERWLRSAHPDWPESGIRGTLDNMERRTDGTVAPWLTRDRHMAVLRGLWEHDPGAIYGRISAPVLLVSARNDRDDHARTVTRDHRVAAAVAGMPRGTAVWFDGADHDIHAQRPVELTSTLLDLAAELHIGAPADGMSSANE
jgi:pimeloyl-ACP methyl ester carboxylesterase